MRKILFTGTNKAVLVDYKLGPLQAGYVRVRHLYSLISAGTEKYAIGSMTEKPKNIQPGYCAVGRIEQGGETCGFKKNDIVFTHGTHVDVIDVLAETARKLFIPVDSKFAKQATFLQLGKVAIHGLHRVNINIGDWIVVFGLGVVGNLTAQLAALNSANRVLAVDPVATRRQIAENIGIKTLDSKQPDKIDQIKDITGGGANVIVETSGNEEALVKSFKIAAYGAQISLVGGHYGIRRLDMKTDFQNKELAIFGARRVDVLADSTNNDFWTVVKCDEEFYKMIKNGQIDVKPLITHYVKPEDVLQIYNKLINNDPEIVATIFIWHEE